MFEGVAVVMELNPEDGTFRAGRSPPGGLGENVKNEIQKTNKKSKEFPKAPG